MPRPRAQRRTTASNDKAREVLDRIRARRGADPDIQGLWPAERHAGQLPYERPGVVSGRGPTLTDAEFAARRRGASQAGPQADGEDLRAAGPSGLASAVRHTGAPESAAIRSARLRSSSDPPNGRIPPMTEEGTRAHRPRAQHLLLRLPGRRRRAPVRNVRGSRSLRIGASRAARSPRCCRPATTWGPRLSQIPGRRRHPQRDDSRDAGSSR